jgi:hypothetical protein
MPVRDERMRLAILALLYFTLAVVPLAFSARTYEQFELPQTLLLRLLVPLMLALTLARFAMGQRWNWQRTPMDIPVLLWTGWVLFKTVFSVSPALRWFSPPCRPRASRRSAATGSRWPRAVATWR